MKLFAIAFAVLLSSSSLADERVPIASVDDAVCGITDDVSAVRNVLMGVGSEHYEFGGIIVELPSGERCITKPVTSRSGYDLNYEVKLTRGARMVGMYHTHPKGMGNSHKHTQLDLRVAHALGVPSYVVSWEDFAIRKYDPANPGKARKPRIIQVGMAER